MSDLNDHIALCKEWICTGKLAPLPEQCNYYSEWLDPRGRVDFRPDFTGTLEGVAGMMRELGGHWVWGWAAHGWVCSRGENCGSDEYFSSPLERPGDCVGEAYRSMKEAVNAV